MVQAQAGGFKSPVKVKHAQGSGEGSPPDFVDQGLEVVDDRVQGQDGDVEAVLGDEREQHVERPGELLQLDSEALLGRGGSRSLSSTLPSSSVQPSIPGPPVLS